MDFTRERIILANRMISMYLLNTKNWLVLSSQSQWQGILGNCGNRRNWVSSHCVRKRHPDVKHVKLHPSWNSTVERAKFKNIVQINASLLETIGIWILLKYAHNGFELYIFSKQRFWKYSIFFKLHLLFQIVN